MDTKRNKILLAAILVLFTLHSYAFADNAMVLKHHIQAVSSVSSGRFIKIAWSVELRNPTPTPQSCKITLSFLNAEDEVISEATKTQELGPRQEKAVEGTVRLRTSIAICVASG